MPIRPIFKLQFSIELVPFFWGLSYAAMSMHQFVMAYSLAVLGTIWALGCYVSSDQRKKRIIKVAKLRNEARKHALAAKVIDNFKRARWQLYLNEIGIPFIVILVSSFFVFWLYLSQQEFDLSQLEGKLYPANEPSPPNTCKESQARDILAFLGSNAAVIDTPTFILLKVSGRNIVVINRDSDGLLTISLDVFDKYGRVITRFSDGKFIVNQNNILNMKRKDRSSLQVVDQYGTEVLNVRYLNPQALRIDGVLNIPGMSKPIVFNETSSLGVSETCMRAHTGTLIEINGSPD